MDPDEPQEPAEARVITSNDPMGYMVTAEGEQLPERLGGLFTDADGDFYGPEAQAAYEHLDPPT